jgi:AsmA protein
MKSWIKWFAVPVSVVTLLLIAALMLPFFVDLEKFKPQIQSAVASAVNAELDFKSIRLHAIPKLGVTIKSAEIRNTDAAFQGTTLFKTDEIFLATEFWPLLKGQLEGELRIVKPAIDMAMLKGTNNLASLAKPSQAANREPTASPTPDSGTTSPTPVSELRKRVLIKSVAIVGATANIKNNGEPLAGVNELDLLISNIGLDRDIKIDLLTDIKAKEADAAVQGPVKMAMTAKITTSDTELFKSISVDGKFDVTGLAVNFRNALVKKPGQVITMRIRANATPVQLDVQELGFDILNIAGNGKMKLSDFKSLATALEIAIKSPDISSLAAILPQHEKLLQKASLDFSARVNGPVSDLSEVKAEVDLASKLTGTDVDLSVLANSVLPAKMQIAVKSSRMDLGALLKPFMRPKTTTSAAPNVQSGVASDGKPTGDTAEKAEKDFVLAPEIKETLKPHEIGIDVALKEIIFDALNIKDLGLKASFRNLEAAIQQFSMQTLGGSIRAGGRLQLAQDPVQFQGNVELNGVSASEAIAVVAPEHKDAIHGFLTTSMSVAARGTTRQTLTHTLTASGAYQLKDTEVKGASLRPLVAESFSGFVGGLTSGKIAEKTFTNIEKFLASPIGQKIPAEKRPKIEDLRAKLDAVKNVKIPDKYAGEKRLGSTSGKFEIKDGKVKITSDVASDLGQLKLAASASLDGKLDGTATVNVSDQEKQKLLAQSEYVGLLFDKDKNLLLPFTVGGTLSSPKLGMVTGELAKSFEANATVRLEQEAKKAVDVAAADARKAVEAAAKDAIKKAVPQLDDAKVKEAEAKAKERSKDAQKKLEADAKEKLKGLFKKKN